MTSIDTLKTRSTLTVNGVEYDYYSLSIAAKATASAFEKLPVSMKILLENCLRHEDNKSITLEDIQAFGQWLSDRTSTREIAYRPARVLMQDFTGVPAVVDLAAIREAIQKLGGDPDRVNPMTPVDLVIDHSVQVAHFGTQDAFRLNTELEMQQNSERYEFLRWGQKAFQNFKVVPPGAGICHQINLEYLAKTVWTKTCNNRLLAFPDTLVGTDSHTTMINGLGVLGWGVGGIEAEAAMLGQPISMLIPDVIGVKLTGKLKEGITATDLVLTLTQLLRKKNVVGKFVEYYGPGLKELSLANRATLANMAPEYGATCGFFPIDEATLAYLRLTGRSDELIALVEAYAKAQGLWYNAESIDPLFTDILELDLATIEPSIAGPKRPQDRVGLSQLKSLVTEFVGSPKKPSAEPHLQSGDIVIAAITSCTNTSNPSVLITAGLLAKNAVAQGLKTKPWVKTSLAPGSQVVSRYLDALGLQTHLDTLGFRTVGFGCTTCIGNSGPLPESIAAAIQENNLIVSAILSGNRNFEGRIHPQVKANWLASPPLVVAFALAGTMQIDLTQEPLGKNAEGLDVYLKDIWPTDAEINTAMQAITETLFKEQYAQLFEGSLEWQALTVPDSKTYTWHPDSTYIQNPPFFDSMQMAVEPIQDIKNARILALFGDSITTDHISPAGSIKKESPSGLYLLAKGVAANDFNSLGARRGNHEVMMRGTFGNIRIKNEMLPDIEGGFTSYLPTGETLSIYDAAMRYQKDHTPLIIIAGKEYGTGSSRDWAAKGPKLLGVRAVIAESFERIHRSNLIGMGILPLEFTPGTNRKTLQLTGREKIDILDLADGIKPRMRIRAVIHRDQSQIEIALVCRIDTVNEAEYYAHGGILQYVIRNIMRESLNQSWNEND